MTYEYLKTVTTVTKKRFGPLQTGPQTRDCYFKRRTFSGGAFSKTTRIWTVSLCGHFPSNWADRLIRSWFSTHVCRAHRERSRKFHKIWKSLKRGKNVETIETSWNSLKTIGQLEKGTLFLFVVCVCFVSFYFFSIFQLCSTFFTLFQVFSTVSIVFKIPEKSGSTLTFIRQIRHLLTKS